MPLALVTGAPGWLGTRLVESLIAGLPDVPALSGASGRPVRCLVRGPAGDRARPLDPAVELSTGDLRDPASLERFTEGARGATLFHVAGVVHPRSVREFFAVNVEGTRRLIEAARGAGVRRLVHVSATAPIGWNAGPEQVFDEAAAYNPSLGYGRSKQLAEELVNAAGRAGDLETVIVRPPWFYGPNQPLRQTLFFRMIRKGTLPLVGSGDNRRSMAYIDNICQGLLLCERVDAARGQTYWIADRRPYSMAEIITTIEELMETELGVKVAHRRIRLPGFVSEVALLLDRALQALRIYNRRLHALSEMNRTIACSIAKAEAELGYRPTVDLREGMRRSLRWLLDRGVRP